MPPTICSCAQVTCGGDHCPVDHAIRQVTEKIGQQPHPDNPEHFHAVTEQFYADTEAQYQKNCAFRDEPRRKCCRIRIYIEMLKIQKTGACQPQPLAPAAILAHK